MEYIKASSGSFSVYNVIKHPEIGRRSANYHPNVWGDYFLTHTAEYEAIESDKERLQKLKEEVRKMLLSAERNSSSQLNLIDQIQRLGVSYHFEGEIEEALKNAYDTLQQHGEGGEDDLYNLALSFRLLRQQGYNVSSDVFERVLKDNKGMFKESITTDVQGMLSLYEATHMKVHGEDILEEALNFTTTHLKAKKAGLRNPLASEVARALNRPIIKALPRLEAKHYLHMYQTENTCNKLLLDFAKLDFNLLQIMHQRELRDISRWWTNLDFANKLPFVRDRIVECYFWILGVYFAPQYLFARKILTQVISLTSTLDDIYDVHGTFEELELFTNIIERWDMKEIDILPEYMRVCYKAILDVYGEMEEELTRQGRSYCFSYAKAAMKRQVWAYFEEAKWFYKNHVPTFDEYMQNAKVSSGYPLLSVTSIVGMTEASVTKEALEWVSNDPLIVTASSTIARLMDDMAGHEIEQERGDVASAVECYMKQHNVSKQEALDVLWKYVTNAWKDINQECLGPTAEEVPRSLLMPILNLARVMDILYKDNEDCYTNSKTRTTSLIASLLIEPVQT